MNWQVFSIVWVALLLPLTATARIWSNVALLVAAGIDIHDEEALIKASTHAHPMLKRGAAEALGDLPKSRRIVAALTRLTESVDDQAAAIAASSLVDFNDFAWVRNLAARLESIRDPSARIQICGSLAKARHYRGWRIVKAAIESGRDPIAFEAIVHVPDFRGMKDAAGKPVDLATQIEPFAPRLSEASQNILRLVIRDLRSKP